MFSQNTERQGKYYAHLYHHQNGTFFFVIFAMLTVGTSEWYQHYPYIQQVSQWKFAKTTGYQCGLTVFVMSGKL